MARASRLSSRGNRRSRGRRSRRRAGSAFAVGWLAAVIALAACGGEARLPHRADAFVPPTPPASRRLRRGGRPQAGQPFVGAIRRGLQFLCRTRWKRLRHDTAMGVAYALRAWPLPEFADCAKRLADRALADRDHPLNVLIDPTRKWSTDIARIKARPLPAPGEKRVNPNTVVFRAVHCREAGFGEAVLRYVRGGMRDRGGYHTAHALWAVLLARERGCLTRVTAAPIIGALHAELAEAQRAAKPPTTTRDIDLYAERLIFLAWQRAWQTSVRPAPAAELKRFARVLIQRQRPSGAFAARDDEAAHWLQHATTVSVWALAQIWRHLYGPPRPVPKK